MIRSGKTVATVLSALLVVGVAGVASAQTNEPSNPPNSAQGQPSSRETSQEQFDRDKVTLKDEVQQHVSSADANIDALKNMTKNEKGATKQQHENMEKQLSSTRDRLKNDLDKIDKASMSDWSTVRPAVERDLNTASGELERVAAITKVPTPRTGAANKQPPSGTTNQQPQNNQRQNEQPRNNQQPQNR